MKTKFKVLGILVLLLVPFAAANAAPFTISGLKKASEVWLKGDGGFDDFSNWGEDQYVQGVIASGKSSPKVSSLSGDYKGLTFEYAIKKKNGSLKAWGEAVFNGEAFVFTQFKKKAFPGWAGWEKAVAAQPIDSSAQDSTNPSSENGNSDFDTEQGEIPGGGYKIPDLAQQDLPNGNNNNNGPAPVPEPATMLLLGSGLIGLAGFARKKFKK